MVPSLVLSGYMDLDQLSLKLMGAQVILKGDGIHVKDTNIDGVGPFAEVVVQGGRATFERTTFSVAINVTHTTVSFFNCTQRCAVCTPISASYSWVSVSDSVIANAGSNSPMPFVFSTVYLTDSSLQLGHGQFSLQHSNATLTRSSVSVVMGVNGMSIENSNVDALCMPAPSAAFEILDSAGGPPFTVVRSQLAFHNCSCDMNRAIKVGGRGGGGINIDASSVHYEGCASPEGARPVLV